MKYFWVLLLGTAISLSSMFAQVAHPTYWISLKDKGASLVTASPALGVQALAQREQKGIPVDARDYPLDGAYIATLKAADIQIKGQSRWLNALAAPLSPDQYAYVSSLPFVRALRPMGTYQSVPAQVHSDCPEFELVDTYQRQLSMLQLDRLHASGYTGQGITIAVFDNGFYRVDSLPGFAHLFSEGRILGTRDFIRGNDEVFDCRTCQHGTFVLSILATVMPGQLIGSAPGANYLLLHTENNSSETSQEELNWIMGAEYADSMGAQVFSTSLGYGNFDGVHEDYAPEEYDGDTPMISQAADIAASKGIVVVNSAGNNGRSSFYPRIDAPADGDSVVAVGSVDACERYSSFSSRGPTADGQIKPDVTAMGEGTFFLSPDGRVRTGNGTSFSCPLVSGMVACLLQAAPDVPNMELVNLLRKTADRAATPDLQYGYGIPQPEELWPQLAPYLRADAPLTLAESSVLAPFDERGWTLYPNPTQDVIYVAMDTLRTDAPLRVEWTDISGRTMGIQTISFEDRRLQIPLSTPAVPGFYVIIIRDEGSGAVYLRRQVAVMGP